MQKINIVGHIKDLLVWMDYIFFYIFLKKSVIISIHPEFKDLLWKKARISLAYIWRNKYKFDTPVDFFFIFKADVSVIADYHLQGVFIFDIHKLSQMVYNWNNFWNIRREFFLVRVFQWFFNSKIYILGTRFRTSWS